MDIGRNLITNCGPIGLIEPKPDVTVMLVVPGHHKLAIGQRRHLRIILLTRGLCVDHKISRRQRTPRRVINPTRYAVIGTILIVRLPRCRKAAIGKPCHRRLLLITACGRVHPEIGYGNASIGIVYTGPDVIHIAAVMVAARIVHPVNHKAAARQAGH